MISGYRIRSLIGIANLWYPQKCTPNSFELYDFVNGVPLFTNSLWERVSWMISLPRCVAMASCMEKPNHMCETMSMLGIVSFVRVHWKMLKTELCRCPPTSFFSFWRFGCHSRSLSLGSCMSEVVA